MQYEIFDMVAHSLRVSDAPRFLLAMFSNEPGMHEIDIDGFDGTEVPVEGRLFVAEDRALVTLSFETQYDYSLSRNVTSVWHHYRVENEMLKEAKTHEETQPSSFDYEIDLGSLAADIANVNDLCDACALPRSPEVAQTEPPATKLSVRLVG